MTIFSFVKTSLRPFIPILLLIFSYPLKSDGLILRKNKKVKPVPVESLLDSAIRHYKIMTTYASNNNNFPLSVEPDGKLKVVKTDHWTSGFFPGTLWYLYEYSKDSFFFEKAKLWTEKLEKEKNNSKTHDIGFIIYCSYGNGYRLTQNPTYLEVILEASNSLTTRFNPKVGCIRSWDWGSWKYPVIIDNMMNLEMLFFASQLTKDPTYKKIAVSHAQKTLINQFRGDYSCWHVIDYNPENGMVEGRYTHQGFNDESTWSRGVAWSIYGYTLCYRETGNADYLRQAVNILNFFTNHPHLPHDIVPYWDFSCPEIPNTYRDASSASIIAAALAELYLITKERSHLALCEKIIWNLASENYFLGSEEKYGFLLDHSVGNIHKNWEVDAPLNYADYYFVEALIKLKKIYEND